MNGNRNEIVPKGPWSSWPSHQDRNAAFTRQYPGRSRVHRVFSSSLPRKRSVPIATSLLQRGAYGKTRPLGAASRKAWVLPTLIAVLNLSPAGRVTAQTFTTLHSFTG